MDIKEELYKIWRSTLGTNTMPGPTLPIRLEAWDMESQPDGWALRIGEVHAWAASVLAECEAEGPSVAVTRLYELLDHLKSSDT